MLKVSVMVGTWDTPPTPNFVKKSLKGIYVLEQEISSVELRVCPMQLFHFLIMSRKSDDFSLRYSDILIFKMAAVLHFGIA